MWLDRDRDGVVDSDEPVLAGVPVTLTTFTPAGASVATTASTGHLTAVHFTPAQATAAHPAAAHATGVAEATVTDSAGHYHFYNVATGSYTVSASVVAAGFQYTYDSDGQADWMVEVQIENSTPIESDFAGLGTGTLSGTVYDDATLQPIREAAVSCLWSGLDGVFGTADDATLNLVANADGTFTLGDAPYGAYSCSGVDPVTGSSSAQVVARVASDVPTPVDLPIGEATPQVPTALLPNEFAGSSLPRTGNRAASLLAVAVALLLSGAGALLLGRRRKYGPGRATGRGVCSE